MQILTAYPLFTTPITTHDFNELIVSESVVFCKDDASLPPGAYLGMAPGLGEFNLIETKGSHEALFTHPAVVARDMLQAIGA